MIKKFDWKTHGRKGDEVKLINKKNYKENKNEKIRDLINLYGGLKNLKHISACASRLRIIVHNKGKIQIEKIKEFGALGFIEKGESSQAIFGGKSIVLSNKMNEKCENEKMKRNFEAKINIIFIIL